MSAGTCRDCGRPIRDPHTLLKDAPGTVRGRTADMCVTCHARAFQVARKSRAGVRYTNEAEANHAHNRAGLVAYLQDRRRRGIPDDGSMQCLENA